MEKSFDTWNEKKKVINNLPENTFFHQREIWWCSLGVNVGQEQDGKNVLFERPVLILKKFNKNIFWALPISSSIKNNIFNFHITYQNQERSILLSQLRLMSSKRLLRKIHTLSPEEFRNLVVQLKDLLP